jgi:S1-C subfamily serine protease
VSDRKLGRRAFLGGLAAGTVGLAGCSRSELADADGPGGEPAASAPQATAGSADQPADGRFSRVYRAAAPSVAQLLVRGPTGRSQGTGFVVDGSHLVTNEHVVRGGETVLARFGDGRYRETELLGADAYSDLAVVRPQGLPEGTDGLEWTPSEPPIGAEVLAIGTPFGFEGSVSAGIVSGLNRSIPGPGGFAIPDAIQTDAAVNPGNSGGPLVTMDGQVAGVINSGGGDNIGFAISAALSRRVVPALIEDGEYEHSLVGVRLAPVTPAAATEYGLDRAFGAIVVGVQPGGPADGVLRPADGETTVDGVAVPTGGDVIIAVDGQQVRTLGEFSAYLALNTSPDQTVTLTVVRDGERRDVSLTLAERPEPEF